MKKQSKKSKFNSVIIGAIVGIFTPFAMIPASHNANAAIAVYDNANVMKTIEIVTNTVTMINHMVTEVDLLGKAIQKMDLEKAQQIWGQLETQGKTLQKNHDELKGIGKKNTDIKGVWTLDIGDAEAIIKGTIKTADINEFMSKHYKIVHNNTTDAAKVAKSAQKNNEQINQNVKTIIEASQKSTGTTSAVQANTAMVAQNTQAVMQNTELLSQMVQMEASKQGIDDARRAIGERMLDIMIKNNASLYNAKKANN